jgi:hypothetical protein
MIEEIDRTKEKIKGTPRKYIFLFICISMTQIIRMNDRP